jgi:hypothetical protein
LIEGKIMGDDERITWAIDNVRESIRLDWKKLATKDLSAERRRSLREHLGMCNEALGELKSRRRLSTVRGKLGPSKSDL